MINGTQVTLIVFISNMTSPFGYESSFIATTIFHAGIASLVVGLIIGYFLDRTALYRNTHLILSFLALVSLGSIIFVMLEEASHLMYSLFVTLFCIAATSNWSMGYSFGAELTFPR